MVLKTFEPLKFDCTLIDFILSIQFTLIDFILSTLIDFIFSIHCESFEVTRFILTATDTFANRVDPDETARNEPSH